MYRLTFRSYLNEELHYEEVFRFDSLKDAHAYAGAADSVHGHR